MGVFRTTFIIDEKGVIEQIIAKVDTKNHTVQIFES
jgi:peroxiredoxin Q/BCP